MAQASSTTKRKKKGKSAAPAPTPPAASASANEDAIPGGWRTWAIAGVVLVGGVVAWKLAGSTYHSDIEAICNGEKGSGYTIEKDMPKVSEWVRAHLSTPEGNEFFSNLSDATLADRAKRLQAEADKLKIRSCAIVPSYEQLAAEGQYRADLQHLCSGVTFTKLVEDDDGTRLHRLEDWIDKQAKSPRTKELADPLRQAATGADRAKLLRDAASKMDIFSCEVAKTLEMPQTIAKAAGPPQVRVWSAPQVIGPMQESDLAKALVEITPAMDDCYKKGLDRRSDLAGRISVKIEVDPDGDVSHAVPADVDRELDDHDVLMCLLKTIRTMKLPKNDGPLATALIPLELTTREPTAAAAASEEPPSLKAPQVPGGASLSAAAASANKKK